MIGNVYKKLENLKCYNCRTDLTPETIKKISLSEGRATLFCPNCNCFLGLLDATNNSQPKPKNKSNKLKK
jgi:predicted  nucleic acid-binding Zn-ribbon protein